MMHRPKGGAVERGTISVGHVASPSSSMPAAGASAWQQGPPAMTFGGGSRQGQRHGTAIRAGAWGSQQDNQANGSMLVFPGLAVAEFSAAQLACDSPFPAVALLFPDALEVVSVDENGNRAQTIFRSALHTNPQWVKGGPALLLWTLPASMEDRVPRTFALRLSAEGACAAFERALQQWKEQGERQELKAEGKSRFEEKIEQASAKMYFHYYGQLVHQQNMLQDYVRTGTYYAAVLENRADFEGKVVVDVGAGSGILSLFAAQAGARQVYAIEASGMAMYAQRLATGNPQLGNRIKVIHGKVEEVELPEQADILISEPMGTLLLNERMIETYLIARDRFLKPGGKMFPSKGRIFMAPFSDEQLFTEIAGKALFWQQQGYYGVDLTPLHTEAFTGYFSQPVVDAFDPRVLLAPPIDTTIDFLTAREEDLYEINIPLAFSANSAARVHGLACWFDVLFDGSTVQRWLTTAPGAPTTHWYQLRCVLQQPLHVLAGQPITGRLHMVAHANQSYDINLTMTVATAWAGRTPSQGTAGGQQTSTQKLDLKEPYYRMSQPQVQGGYQNWYEGEAVQREEEQGGMEAQAGGMVEGLTAAQVVPTGLAQGGLSQPLLQEGSQPYRRLEGDQAPVPMSLPEELQQQGFVNSWSNRQSEQGPTNQDNGAGWQNVQGGFAVHMQ